MANTKIRYRGATGLGLILEMRTASSAVIVNTGTDLFSEVNDDDGTYTATVAEALEGDFRVTIKLFDDTIVYNGWVYGIADDTGIYYVQDANPLLATVRDTVDSILQDTGTTLPATLATISSAFSAGAAIQSPVPTATQIELVAGDTYDGSSSPKLTWTVDKDYTGDTISLVLSNSDATTIYGRYPGAVDSSTSVSVSMDATFDTEPTYNACSSKTAIANIFFALVAIDGDSDEETIARGTCRVYKRGATA